MAVETFANAPIPSIPSTAWTTLSAGIDASVTSLTVVSAASFPAAAQYRVLIDNELLLVTAGGGTTTWTVTRGVEGSTAATHASGANVFHTLTAAGLARHPRSMTTAGDTEYLGATGAPTRLASPGDGNYVTTWTSGVPSWVAGVIGPASAVDNAIARFDGTTGKIIQDYTSGAPTISDVGAMVLFKPLVITGGTITTSAPLVDGTQTWNDAGVTFTGWKLAITNTASAVLSNLLDVTVGGTSVFALKNNAAGAVFALNYGTFFSSVDSTAQFVVAGTTATPYFSFNSDTPIICRTNQLASAGTSVRNSLSLHFEGQRWTGAASDTIRGVIYVRPHATIDNSRLVFGFSDNNDQMLVITHGTRVGINTTAPATTLDVNGAVTIAGAFVMGANYLQLTEMTAPAAGAANTARLYTEDNGSGKTRLMAIFASGVSQQIAIEP